MSRNRDNRNSSLLHALDSRAGKIVAIKDASPKQEGLICPSMDCQHPVTPVLNVTNKIQFFRHKPDSLESSERECKNPSGALESIVHRLAKEVIEKRGDIYFWVSVYGLLLVCK